jgi:hypothetical protein
MALFGTTRKTTMAVALAIDQMALTAVTSRKLKINEISLAGRGATSAAAEYQEISVILAAAASVGASTALTVNKFEADSASFASFVAHTPATTAHTITAGTEMLLIGCNVYGGIYRWVARPNGEIVVRNIAASNLGAAGTLLYHNNTASTTAIYTLHTVMDEL